MTQRESAQPDRFDPAERELLRQLVNGELPAWQEFVEQYQAVVYSGARRTAQTCQIVLEQSDLEDITAEVFAAIVAKNYAALRRFEGRSRLSTWLTVLARRHCLRYAQRKQRLNGRRMRDDQAVVDRARGPLAELINSEESGRLESAVGKLNDTDRAVLNLYYDQRLGYAEIGRQLGIAENSVGSRIQRVHKRLRRILDGSRRDLGNAALSSRDGRRE